MEGTNIRLCFAVFITFRTNISAVFFRNGAWRRLILDNLVDVFFNLEREKNKKNIEKAKKFNVRSFLPRFPLL